MLTIQYSTKFHSQFLAFFIAAKKRELNVGNEKEFLKSMESSLDSAYSEAASSFITEINKIQYLARKAILKCVETGAIFCIIII
jgi:hypothetical protein